MNYARIGYMQEVLKWACMKTGSEFYMKPPQYTSQTCCQCGTIDSHSSENQANFHCTCCRFAENADLGASVNVAVLVGAAAGMAVVKQKDVARLFGLPVKEPPACGRSSIA